MQEETQGDSKMGGQSSVFVCACKCEYFILEMKASV